MKVCEEKFLTKSELRKKVLKERDSYSEEYINIVSEKIFEQIEELVVFKNAKTVFTYLEFGSEIKTSEFIRKYFGKKRIFIPKIHGNNMILVEINSLKQLEKNSFGILEPKSNDYYEGNIDLVITPSVAFDKKGYRVGYGKGYYDRYFSLENYRYSIGLTYSKLLLESCPREDHDIPVDLVISY